MKRARMGKTDLLEESDAYQNHDEKRPPPPPPAGPGTSESRQVGERVGRSKGGYTPARQERPTVHMSAARWQGRETHGRVQQRATGRL